MGTTFQVVSQHFDSYDQKGVETSLGARKPPPPIFTAPIKVTAIFKALTLDTILYGTSLSIIYSISSFCIRKISGKSVPPLSKRFWGIIVASSPLFVYRSLQVIVGFGVHPASIPLVRFLFIRAPLEENRKQISDEYQAMRISTLSSTRHQIDGVFLKRKGLDLKGRCLLVSQGNAAHYEQTGLSNTGLQSLANRLNAHILFYNYVGVGESSGWLPNRDAMVASHEVMRLFLKEIGTTEVFDYGWSIGGGVKWRDHFESPLQDENYWMIDYQSFRSTSRFGKEILGVFGEQVVRALQWEYNSEEASKRWSHKHIIIQDGDPEAGEVFYDGVISVENSLATDASKDKVILMNTRKVYGVQFRFERVHGYPLDAETVNRVVKKIEATTTAR